MTTTINHRSFAFNSLISKQKNQANFAANSFQKFVKNQLDLTAQKALKGGNDGDDDIIIEDTIGG